MLLEDIADTSDVVEDLVNVALSGKPGPVHLHVPEDLTERGVEVENYHDVRLHVPQVLPDPARVETVPRVRTVVVGCGDGCYALSGFELMTAVENDIPVTWVVVDDSQFKLIELYQLSAYGRSALVEFQNPDFGAYARACGADGYTVDTEDEFEQAFAAAPASGRPPVIDARITRWAVPHYSPSPDGVIEGLVEMIEERFRAE